MIEEKEKGRIVAFYLAGHSLAAVARKFRHRRDTISDILHSDPESAAKLEKKTKKRRTDIEAAVCARSSVLKQAPGEIAKKEGITSRTVHNIQKRNPGLISSLTEVQRELAESIGFLEKANQPVILGLFCQCWELMTERRSLDEMVKGAKALQLLKSTYGVMPEQIGNVGNAEAQMRLVTVIENAIMSSDSQEDDERVS